MKNIILILAVVTMFGCHHKAEQQGPSVPAPDLFIDSAVINSTVAGNMEITLDIRSVVNPNSRYYPFTIIITRDDAPQPVFVYVRSVFEEFNPFVDTFWIEDQPDGTHDFTIHVKWMDRYMGNIGPEDSSTLGNNTVILTNTFINPVM